MEAGGYSSARLVENLIKCYVRGKKCAFYVVLGLRYHFQERKLNVKGNCLYLVTYRLEMSTCSTVEGLAMSDLFCICFGEALTFQVRQK